MKIWILLPAYNEEKSLINLLPKFEELFQKKQCDYRIVVVNDGSTDSTAKVLQDYSKDMPIDVVNHSINRGLGETERDGFEYIAAHCEPKDIIARMDCDDTHEPNYVFDLISKLQEGYDVVNTSRFQPGGGQMGVNAYRGFISRCANLFMKVLFNINGVKDYSCGYRVYRGAVIQTAIRVFGNGFIQLKGLGFTSTLETIVKLKLLGCKFAEVPFVLRYDQKVSSSKMVSSVTTMGYFAMAILYHWPWGGWRYFYKNLNHAFQESPQQAIDNFAYNTKKRSPVCKIGG